MHSLTVLLLSHPEEQTSLVSDLSVVILYREKTNESV